MRYLLTVLFILTCFVSIGQVYNPTPQYVFKNKLGVGRSTPVDSAAYMNVGPNGGAVAGIVLPRVADTLTISGTKRHGLLIFSNQLDKFAWYDSTNARWQEVGSGSGSSGGEVMLMNGSRTVGDSLLFTTITGDTAYIRNILAGSGLLFENMGDTVLKLNVDSSTVPNIYNSDGTITDAERYVKLDSAGYFQIRNFEDDFGFLTISDAVSSGSSVGMSSINKNTGLTSSMGANARFTDSTAQSTLSAANVKDGQTYVISVVLDSSGINFGGSLNYGLTDKPSSANAVQFADNSIYILSDLTSAAASRTFRTIPKSNGSYLKIINQSSDATYKWTFTGITVYDKDGSTVTNIDDHSVYELIYIAAGQSEFGAGWHITNKY